MARPTVRSIVAACATGSYFSPTDGEGFLRGLSACGVLVDSAVPMSADPVDTPLALVSALVKAGQYAYKGEKINAIKEVRTALNLGLKDAKDIVEAFVRGTNGPTY